MQAKLVSICNNSWEIDLALNNVEPHCRSNGALFLEAFNSINKEKEKKAAPAKIFQSPFFW